MTPIELIAIDLDGTLLNSKHQLSERNEGAIKKALAHGVKVILVTGKTHFSAKYLIETFGLKTPSIFNQGLVTALPDGKVTHQSLLDPDVARFVITYAEEKGFDIAAYSGTRILVKTLNTWFEDLNRKYNEPMPEAVGDIRNILDEIPINKLLVLKEGKPAEITELRGQFEVQLVNKVRVLQPSFGDMMEILPPNTGKGAALKTLLNDLGVMPEKVMAIGDGENDIDMFHLVGLGIAMGNAWDIVKNAANVVVGTNDEDGVAQAIEQFVLNGTPQSTEKEG